MGMSYPEKQDNWVEVEERLPDVFAGKFRIRQQNGDEVDAEFYQDRIAWAAFYGQKTGYWWSAHGKHENIDNVTHWRERARD